MATNHETLEPIKNPPAITARNTTRARILAALTEQFATVEEIADRAGFHKSTARRHLLALREGLLVMGSRDIFRLRTDRDRELDRLEARAIVAAKRMGLDPSKHVWRVSCDETDIEIHIDAKTFLALFGTSETEIRNNLLDMGGCRLAVAR